ncbi:formyl transferase family protein [Synechococcus sp. BIOS-E4-1]|nr:formyl transferase family protein [Synechococcus sp. BIOS-E4-1]
MTAVLSAELGIPLLDYDSAMERAFELDIDLGISVLYWRKLKGALLFPQSKHGCVNFHPALLPQYKGCAGYNLAIMDGLSQWGSTCHYVDEEIDTGGILDVQKFNVDSDFETALSLEAKTLNVMEQQFRRVIQAILASPNGRLSVSPNIGGKYVSRFQMEELKQILPGEDPDRKSRAFWFPPYCGAWVEVNGQRVNVIPDCVLRAMGDPTATSLFADPCVGKI